MAYEHEEYHKKWHKNVIQVTANKAIELKQLDPSAVQT